MKLLVTVFLLLSLSGSAMGSECVAGSKDISYELAVIASTQDENVADDHILKVQYLIAEMSSQDVEKIDTSVIAIMGMLLARRESVIVVGMAQTLAQIGPRAKFLLPKLRGVIETWPEDAGMDSIAVKETLRKAAADLDRATAPNQE
jgi:hypothetical protein